MGPTITKGTRIRAQFFSVNDPLSCLTGVMMKFGCHSVDVTGIVRHVRGDDPVNQTTVTIFIGSQRGNPVL